MSRVLATLILQATLLTNPGTLTFASTSTETFDGAAQNLATGVSYGNLVAGEAEARKMTADE